MPADTDNDYHVKEIQDMIAVMQRMIKDGKKLRRKFTAYFNSRKILQSIFSCC